MKQKIGVLTTFYSKNYGAALQAYALCQILIKSGFKAELINYKKAIPNHYVPNAVKKDSANQGMINKLVVRSKNFFIKYLSNQQKYTNSEIRNCCFESFVNELLPMSKESYNSPEEFFTCVSSMAYDTFICGSDQVWNPMVHGFDPVYYLNFKTSAKKVSYAPSVAYSRFDDDELSRIGCEISSIDSLSIREASSAKQLQPFVKKKISTVIDPTFLLSGAEWRSIRSNFCEEEKYVLVYILNYNEYSNRITRLVSDFAKKHNYKIICLPYTNIKFSGEVQVDYRYDVAPNDFIHLVDKASMIITNSFHATAISINLNRDFLVVSSENRNHDLQVRLSDLLEIFNLENRRFFSDTPFISEEKIEYEIANRIIDEQRNSGLEFLKKAIGANEIG
ncbi:MAG: polysaccharide pyruvyl transferase family protein [Acidaminococcaceae bacterium]